MTTNEQTQKKQSAGSIIFWILWVIAFVIFPFYAFTFLIEVDTVKAGNIESQLSPVIGAAVFIAQVVVMVISFKQKKRGLPLSKPYLTLLGGTILIGFIWAGGCAIMGPFSLH